MPHTSSTFTSFQMAARYIAVYIMKNKLPIESKEAAILAWEQAHRALLIYYKSEGDVICLNDALRLKVLPTFNHLAIQDFLPTSIDKVDPPSDVDDASVTVAEEVNPTRPIVPAFTLLPRGDEQKSTAHRVRFALRQPDATPRAVSEHNPFAARPRQAAGIVTGGVPQGRRFAGATPRYMHNTALNTPSGIFMGQTGVQPIPGVPFIVPRPPSVFGNGHSTAAVGVRAATSRPGMHRLYDQLVNIRSEQSSEINLDHISKTTPVEIRLTIRWALLGFKEKDTETIDNIIKAFRARNTVDNGLSAVAAYLKRVYMQNSVAQSCDATVSSMQNAVTCTVDRVSYDLIDGKFQPTCSPRHGFIK